MPAAALAWSSSAVSSASRSPISLLQRKRSRLRRSRAPLWSCVSPGTVQVGGELRFSEFFSHGAGLTTSLDALLHCEHSGIQHICVVQSPVFGRMLLLDGMVMLTEWDEFIYHEMLVHPALPATVPSKSACHRRRRWRNGPRSSPPSLDRAR